MTYTLADFNNINFEGFDFILPESSIDLINRLSKEVGSPNYIKTPVFQKKDKQAAGSSNSGTGSLNGGNIVFGAGHGNGKKKKKNEQISDEEWETIRNFQATKIEQKTGIDAEIDQIRSNINKISDKTFVDLKNKIIEIIDNIQMHISNEEMISLSKYIFNLASTNRFYSKLYADLYSELMCKYDLMKETFENSFNSFLDIFNNIEYVDDSNDYKKFLQVNQDNEKRRALSAFFINLYNSNIIKEQQIVDVICNLLSQINDLIKVENKKNEVDEITENIFILCTKGIMDKSLVGTNGININEVIKKLAHSKSKTYPSLSNKSIFKFMDMVEM